MIPPTGLDEAEQIEQLGRAVERLKSHEGPFHRHPIFELLTPAQWRDFHTICAMHHLSFLVTNPGTGAEEKPTRGVLTLPP